MARNPRTFALIFCLLLLTGIQAAHSQAGRSLPFPDSAKDIIAAVERACPGCAQDGFVPTGTDKIGFGRNFYPHFFTGDPAVGILISHAPTKKAFMDLLRNQDYDSIKEKLASLFAKTCLVVIQKESNVVHVSGPPAHIMITLTQMLHQCLAASDKLLCCGCTGNDEDECCEKRLGSTFVAMQWEDPLNPGHTIEYRYFPHPGDSKLLRYDETGRKTGQRWCLDSDGTGILQ